MASFYWIGPLVFPTQKLTEETSVDPTPGKEVCAVNKPVVNNHQNISVILRNYPSVYNDHIINQTSENLYVVNQWVYFYLKYSFKWNKFIWLSTISNLVSQYSSNSLFCVMECIQIHTWLDQDLPECHISYHVKYKRYWTNCKINTCNMANIPWESCCISVFSYCTVEVVWKKPLYIYIYFNSSTYVVVLARKK